MHKKGTPKTPERLAQASALSLVAVVAVVGRRRRHSLRCLTLRYLPNRARESKYPGRSPPSSSLSPVVVVVVTPYLVLPYVTFRKRGGRLFIQGRYPQESAIT